MSPISNLLQSLSFVCFGTKAVGVFARIQLVRKLVRAHAGRRGTTASSFGEHLVLIEAVLRVPRDTPGDIAEFGCYKGMSTIALSIAAKQVGRTVRVFDSFAGLPETQVVTHNLGTHRSLVYKKGDYAASLDEVKSAVAQYGELGCCEFVSGYYAETLSRRPPNETYALIFEDADLVESVADVLRYAWPRLSEGGAFFCHEARDLEVVTLFYDVSYWRTTHNTAPPGLVGAGVGLPIDSMRQQAFDFGKRKTKGSCLGYTYKRPAGLGRSM